MAAWGVWASASRTNGGIRVKSYLAKLASDFEKQHEIPEEEFSAGLKKITGTLRPGSRVAWCFDEDVALWKSERMPFPHPMQWPYQGLIVPFPETDGRGVMEPENVCLVVTDYPIEKENPVTDWHILACLFGINGFNRLHVFELPNAIA
jgi:hypothetical protein